MEINVKRVIYHILDTGASEPLLSDRKPTLDADLTEYFTVCLEKAFAADDAASASFCPTPPLPRSWQAIRISSTCPAGLPG